MKSAGPEFHVSLKGNKFHFTGFANNEYEDKEMGSISKQEYDKYKVRFHKSAAPASLNELTVLMEDFVFGDRREKYGL